MQEYLVEVHLYVTAHDRQEAEQAARNSIGMGLLVGRVVDVRHEDDAVPETDDS